MEALRAQERDRAERETVIQKQLAERRTLQQRLKLVRAQQHEAVQDLTREAALYARLGKDGPDEKPERSLPGRERDRSRGSRTGRGRDRSRGDDGPDFGL